MTRALVVRCTPLFVALSGFVATLAACGGQVVGDPGGCPAGAHCVDDAGADGEDGSTVDGAILPDGAIVDVGPTTCGGGACPFAGFSCSDGCNTCTCTGSEWACTTRACVDAGPDFGEDTISSGCGTGEPKVGSACSDPSLSCTYANSCGGTTDYTCKGGHWNAVGGTCPPPPTCPTTTPVGGIPCSQPAGTMCGYSNGCGGKISATCSGARWNVVTDPCTAPTCPTSTPKPATSCPGAMKCSYPATCGGFDTFVCQSDPTGAMTWTNYPGTCPGATCPTAEPANGSSCTSDMSCWWATACGALDTGKCAASSATGTRQWTVTKAVCSACPSKPPATGVACVGDVFSCNYSNGCGGFTQAYCKGGTWNSFTNACVAGCPSTLPTSGAKCASASSTPCQYIPGTDPTCTESCFCATDGRWACLPATCADGGTPPPTPTPGG